MARRLTVDRTLLSTVLLLVGFGLVMVYSASIVPAQAGDAPVMALSPFTKQALVATLGVGVLVGLLHFDYRLLRRPLVVYPLLVVVLSLLVAVHFAPPLNNVNRWLFVGGFSLQPSELAKVFLVIYLAYQLDRKAERVNTRACLLPCTVVVALCAGLVVLEPDYGSAALLLGIATIMLLLGGLAWRYLLAVTAVTLPTLLLFALWEPYRRARILTFFDPTGDPLDKGWQIAQSLIAVGSGGLTGLGLGQSVQKLSFLPFANSDFIFAIVCEELGLLGGLGLLTGFGVLAVRGLQAGDRAPDALGRYLAWGLTALLVVQALTHMCIVLGLLPTKGMPLPFVSYGGTSLLATLLAAGLLINVSQHATTLKPGPA